MFTCSGFVHYVFVYNVNFYSHYVQDDNISLLRAAEHFHTEVVKYLHEYATAQVTGEDRVSH